MSLFLLRPPPPLLPLLLLFLWPIWVTTAGGRQYLSWGVMGYPQLFSRCFYTAAFRVWSGRVVCPCSKPLHLQRSYLPSSRCVLLQVLTTGYWPAYKPLEVTLPLTMKDCTEVFKAYYADTTS